MLVLMLSFLLFCVSAFGAQQTINLTDTLSVGTPKINANFTNLFLRSYSTNQTNTGTNTAGWFVGNGSNITVTPTGGNTPTKLSDFLNQKSKNVLYYGVKGDGATPDDVVVQALLNTGGAIYFPPVTTFYRFTNSLIITNSGTVLFSDTHGQVNGAMCATLKWDAAFAGVCIDIQYPVPGSGVNIYGVTLHDMFLWSANPANTTVQITRGYQTTIEHCKILGANGSVGIELKAGTSPDWTTGTIIARNFIIDCMNCIKIGPICTETIITENYLNGYTTPGAHGATLIAGMNDGQITLNNIEGGDFGVTVAVNGGATITDNRFEAQYTNMIVVSNNAAVHITGNYSANDSTLFLGNSAVNSTLFAQTTVATNFLHGTFYFNRDRYGSPAFYFMDENVSIPPMAQLKLYSGPLGGSVDTNNAFGEFNLPVPELDLASKYALKLGTYGDYNVGFYRYNQLMMEITNANIAILSGSVSFGTVGKGIRLMDNDDYSILFRSSGNNLDGLGYYAFGGTLANGEGHKFYTGGDKASQTLKVQIANDGTYMLGPVSINGTVAANAVISTNAFSINNTNGIGATINVLIAGGTTNRLVFIGGILVSNIPTIYP